MGRKEGKSMWTEEQKAAINTKDCNILVNAAAGSGKTAVLVERIIEKVKNGTDIDSLLVVTFTKAAAAEMRERISAALTEALRKNTGDTNLKEQLMLLNYADITTIDSFCHNVVRNNFHLLGLDPNFTIADDATIKLMKDEALDEVFDELYDKLYKEDSENEISKDDFRAVVNMYSKNRSDHILRELVLEIYNFIATMPYPDKWLDEACKKYKLDGKLLESEFAAIVIERMKLYINECIRELETAKNYIDNKGEVEEYKQENNENDDNKIRTALYGNYYTLVNDEKAAYEAVRDAFEKNNWNLAVEKVSNVKYENAKAPKKEKASAYVEILKNHRNNAKALFGKVQVQMCDKAEEIEELFDKKLEPAIRVVTNIVKKFEAQFLEKKQSKNTYGFEDIEHFCLALLKDKDGKPTALANELREKYSEILLDEYQDSNDLQEAIFTTISNGKNMFMVGDMKQSIYRFRNADPTLFKNKSESYSSEVKDGSCKITLSKNFRSRKSVLDTVNSVFEKTMSRSGVGEIDYDDEQKLNLGAKYYYGADAPDDEDCKDSDMYKSEFLLVRGPAEGDDALLKDNEEEWENTELEALMIAERIKELKESGFQVTNKDGTKRGLQNRDIAVLVRTKTQSTVFADALKSVGIEAYVESDNYFNKPEVMLMLSLLNVLLNPTQDIPMIAVMRSVIGDFNDDELAEIRMCSGGSIYSAMVRYCRDKISKMFINDKNADDNAENNGDEKILADNIGNEVKVDEIDEIDETDAAVNDIDKALSEKCFKFLKNIWRWRKYAEYMSCDKLIWTLYTETDYYAYAGAISGGEEAQANLRLLFERAKGYESSGFKGLFNFINLIKKMIKKETNLSPAKLITEKHDVVRIMTIHKSKGLEFPVTVVAQMSKEFNKIKPEGAVVMHKELGFGMKDINYEIGYNRSAISKFAVDNRCEVENLSEEMRILYVAMTRAREKLILTGYIKGAKKKDATPKDDKINLWKEKGKNLSQLDILSAKCFDDWIGPVAVESEFWEVKEKNAYDIVAEVQRAADDVVDSEDAAVDNMQQDNAEENQNEVSDFDIAKVFDFKYLYEESGRMPSKISVTELKRRAIREQEESVRESNMFGGADEEKPDKNAYYALKANMIVPDFMRKEEKSFTGAEKGTIIHTVMEAIELRENVDESYIEAELERMVEEGILSAQESKVADVKKIKAFFDSELGRRIGKAGKCYKEMPFEIAISVQEVDKTLGDEYSGEEIILQGIIDGYFEEDGEIVLFDYKTDKYKDKSEIGEKYKIQLEYYRMAIEKLLGKKVKESILYLFYKDEMLVL